MQDAFRQLTIYGGYFETAPGSGNPHRFGAAKKSPAQGAGGLRQGSAIRNISSIRSSVRPTEPVTRRASELLFAVSGAPAVGEIVPVVSGAREPRTGCARSEAASAEGCLGIFLSEAGAAAQLAAMRNAAVDAVINPCVLI